MIELRTKDSYLKTNSVEAVRAFIESHLETNELITMSNEDNNSESTHKAKALYKLYQISVELTK